jgi:hypothetical protein
VKVLTLTLLILFGCKSQDVPVIKSCQDKPHRYDEPYFQEIVLFPSYEDTAVVPPFIDVIFTDSYIRVSCIDTTIFPHYKIIILE